jgi:hypothetical protein
LELSKPGSAKTLPPETLTGGAETPGKTPNPKKIDEKPDVASKATMGLCPMKRESRHLWPGFQT